MGIVKVFLLNKPEFRLKFRCQSFTKSQPEYVESEIRRIVERCETRIDYEFNDKEIIVSALTHASGAGTRLDSNERLEFLGDAILGMVICDHLYQQYPEFLEGDLTKIKSVVVSRKTCARISHALALNEFLIVGKGMKSSGKFPKSLLSDVLESIVAAIYLDGGFDNAMKFIGRHFFPEVIAAVAGELEGNFKSFLQQHSQRVHRCAPIYRMVEQSGPDHQKIFKIQAEVGGKAYAPAWGRNKKEAEQRAAENALTEMRGDPPPHNGKPALD